MNIFERLITHQLRKGYVIEKREGDEVYFKYYFLDLLMKMEKDYTKDKPEYTWVYEKGGAFIIHGLYIEIEGNLYYIEGRVKDEVTFKAYKVYPVDEEKQAFSYSPGIDYLATEEVKQTFRKALFWFEEKLTNLPEYRLPCITGNLSTRYLEETKEWL